MRARTSRSQCPFDFLRHAIIAPPAPCDLRARPRRLLFAIPAWAEKLVISPYTVNTHVRHIYEKMQIHKRSELLNYLNMQRSDF